MADTAVGMTPSAHQAGATGTGPGCVHERLAEVARRRPQAVAVEFAGQAQTYAELLAAAESVAAALLARGVGPGSRVGVCAERSLELPALLAGILRAGAAYVPLDADAPLQRQRLLLEEAGVAVVLAQGPLAGRLEPAVTVSGAEILGAEDALSCTAAPPPVRCGPLDLAYVMFTSGSTGRPKAVMTTHANVVGLATAMAELVDDRDRVLGFAPLSFDASTFELWAPLLAGATVVLAPPGACAPRDLARFARERRVGVMWLTAALFQQVVDQACDLLDGVRTLLTGGDVVPARQAQALLAAHPGCTLVNGYGPTETTTFATLHVVHRLDDLDGGPLPIGRAIAGARTRVLDDDLEPLADGLTGELCIGGTGVALGYLGRPGPTAERFVPDPEGPPGARMYRSGDVVSREPGGDLAFHGRADRQVKLRGYRVEPGELEQAVAGHADVEAAAAVVRTTSDGDKRLVLCVVGPPGVAQALGPWLRERLPAYMVPTVEAVGALPLTPNGKVDREALARGTHDAPATHGTDDAPATHGTDDAPAGDDPLAAELRALWAELLEVPPAAVTADADFFDLGGHSLAVTQEAWRLEERYGIELPVRSLFDEPRFERHVAAVRALLETSETQHAGRGG